MATNDGKMLGILGGGQLGRMFTAEASRMGFQVVVVDPDPDAPAAQIAARHIARRWDDPAIVSELAATASAVSTEWENVPATLLAAVGEHVPVHPGAGAVSATQDRIAEKQAIAAAGAATARWAAVYSTDDLSSAWDAIGGEQGILKTAQLGYDGKGQAVVGSREELVTAFDRLSRVPCILEERLELVAEISVMVARGVDGEVVTWPVGRNVHVNGILHTTVVPSGLGDDLEDQAAALATSIASSLDYHGVLGVELFVSNGGRIVVNELAPRPHNSGHWTLDAAVTSQFEQQVRILAGLPLGSTAQTVPAAMINLLGDLWRDGEPRWERALAIPGVRLHLYGKREARPGRKMGHITALAAEPELALANALKAWHALQP